MRTGTETRHFAPPPHMQQRRRYRAVLEAAEAGAAAALGGGAHAASSAHPQLPLDDGDENGYLGIPINTLNWGKGSYADCNVDQCDEDSLGGSDIAFDDGMHRICLQPHHGNNWQRIEFETPIELGEELLRYSIDEIVVICRLGRFANESNTSSEDDDVRVDHRLGPPTPMPTAVAPARPPQQLAFLGAAPAASPVVASGASSSVSGWPKAKEKMTTKEFLEYHKRLKATKEAPHVPVTVKPMVETPAPAAVSTSAAGAGGAKTVCSTPRASVPTSTMREAEIPCEQESPLPHSSPSHAHVASKSDRPVVEVGLLSTSTPTDMTDRDYTEALYSAHEDDDTETKWKSSSSLDPSDSPCGLGCGQKRPSDPFDQAVPKPGGRGRLATLPAWMKTLQHEAQPTDLESVASDRVNTDECSQRDPAASAIRPKDRAPPLAVAAEVPRGRGGRGRSATLPAWMTAASAVMEPAVASVQEPCPSVPPRRFDDSPAAGTLRAATSSSSNGDRDRSSFWSSEKALDPEAALVSASQPPRRSAPARPLALGPITEDGGGSRGRGRGATLPAWMTSTVAAPTVSPIVSPAAAPPAAAAADRASPWDAVDGPGEFEQFGDGECGYEQESVGPCFSPIEDEDVGVVEAHAAPLCPRATPTGHRRRVDLAARAPSALAPFLGTALMDHLVAQRGVVHARPFSSSVSGVTARYKATLIPFRSFADSAGADSVTRWEEVRANYQGSKMVDTNTLSAMQAIQLSAEDVRMLLTLERAGFDRYGRHCIVMVKRGAERAAHLLERRPPLTEVVPLTSELMCVVVPLAAGSAPLVLRVADIEPAPITAGELEALNKELDGNFALKATMNRVFLRGKMEDLKTFRGLRGLSR